MDVALPSRIISTADGPPAAKPAVVATTADAKPALVGDSASSPPADAAAAVTAKMKEMSDRIQHLEGIISDLRSHPPPPPPFLVHLLRGAGHHAQPPPHFEHDNEWRERGWHGFHHRGRPHHGPHPLLAFLFFFGIVYCTYRFARFVIRQCCCAKVDGSSDDAGVVQYPA